MVHERDAAVGVDKIGVRRKHEQAPVAFLALAEHGVGQLALRDVLQGARLPERTALRVEDHLGDLVNVAHFAVGADDPVFEIDPAQTGRRGFFLPVNHREVVRMDLAIEGGGVGREVLARNAEDPVDLLRPAQAVAHKVVVPVAEAGDLLGGVDPRLGERGLAPVEQADLEEVVDAQQQLPPIRTVWR